jgi:hypothetical protein
MVLEWSDIATRANMKPLKDLSPCFRMPFADESWMKGMNVQAMNSILDNAGIERRWALSDDKKKSTECTELG